MISIADLREQVGRGEFRSLARALTIIENELDGAEELLKSLHPQDCAVVGITGPPGAGKSTLVNALIDHWSAEDKSVAVLAVDPTSPFSKGALLGDRIRMAEHFTKSNVFIRSLATRGSLGGLSEKSIEMTDLLRGSGFDHVVVETVGVGQSEVEIAALADVSIVVLVPESGDEIQHSKSGLMEIAEIFVVNKADRDGADIFANNLKKMVHQGSRDIPVIRTVASRMEGIAELAEAIAAHAYHEHRADKRASLLAERAWKLIQRRKMAGINRMQLEKELAREAVKSGFNLYRFVDENYKS